jgi:tyrosyl-tRNA synthetase
LIEGEKVRFLFRSNREISMRISENYYTLELNSEIKTEKLKITLLQIQADRERKFPTSFSCEFDTDIFGIDKKIEMKMSKSKPNTAIFMTDTFEEVEKKMKGAHCVDKIIEENPILEYFKYIIFEKYENIEFGRPEKFGGVYKTNSYENLENDFKENKIGSFDLKMMCAKYINELLEPTRKYFEENEVAKKLLEKVESFKVTR